LTAGIRRMYIALREGRADMKNALLCLGVAFASLSATCTGVLAAEPGPATEKLEQAIARLRKDYLAKLDSGDEAHELRNLVRDLNAACGKGDWNRVAALLSARGIAIDAGDGAPAAGDAGSEGDPTEELWPVRTESGGSGPDLEQPLKSEQVEYETAGGLSVRALVWRPRGGAQKSPVIVLAHDGLRGTGVASRRLAEDLAGVGYIVYAPEFRGQGRSEGKVEWAQGEVFDLLAAIEEAKKIEGADPGRIGLVGAGHGGAVVLIALARAEGVACATAISPPTDLSGLAGERRFVRELEFMRVRLDLTDRDDLMKRSPLYYVGGIGTPVQILHGGRDKLVPVRFAEEYVSAVKARGKEIKLSKYGLSDDRLVSRLSVYRVDLHNFLAPYLKPPGWKVAKGGKKGGPSSKNDDKRGKKPDRRRRH